MRLSYLIATYNRKDALQRHLDLLMQQTYRDQFEVLVCDDGSTDGTHEMLEQAKPNDRYSLRWFNTGSTENTAAKSKNNGIRAARCPVLIMVDDDNLPHPRLIESYLEKFTPQEVQLGYKSSLQSYLDQDLPVPIEPGIMSTWWEDSKADRFGHFQCGNVCMSTEAARTPAKDGSIGFDERFTGYGHEDTEFGQRVYSSGYRLAFNPNAVTWHMDPVTTPQQDQELKNVDVIRTSALLKKICAEPWPTMTLVYPGFTNVRGMMSPGELRWLYNRASSMESIIEVGSYAGRSTHALLSGCKGPVWSVDEWDPNFISAFGSVEETANIRQEYLNNTAGLHNRKIVELASTMAAKAFPDRSAEMVFIDADHAYGSVYRDIEAWLPKTTKMICGHDYCPSFPGVMQAVQEFFSDHFGLCETIWYAALEAK
jgi:GT2 family glycosyltransferase